MSFAGDNKGVLALSILEEHFGKKVRDVAKVLIKLEQCTLFAIENRIKKGIDFGLNSEPMPVFRSTKQTTKAKDAKSALLVLLQHNCLIIIPRNIVSHEPTLVAAGYKKMDRDQTQYSNLYSLDVDMVIHRLRYGRLIIWVKQKFGDVGVAIINELAFHGRQRFKDIVANVVQIFLSNAGQNDTDDSDISTQIEIEVTNTFKYMIRSRYIVRVRSFGFNYATGPEPEAPAQTYEEYDAAKASKKKRTMKRKARDDGSGSDIDDHVDHDEKKVVEYFPNDATRVVDPFDDNNDILWMIGWDQVIREERNQACINAMQGRLDENCCNILKIILRESMAFEGKDINEKVTAIVKFSTICENFHGGTKNGSSSSSSSSSDNKKGKKDGDNDNSDRKIVQNCIHAMVHDTVKVLSYVTDYGQSSSSSLSSFGNPEVYINLHNIIAHIQENTIHSIACERFSQWTGRIVRLLMSKKYVEQGKLGDLAIIPSRDARELIYKLYRAQWIDYQEISKRSDFNPASTYYFWTLDREKIVSNLINSSYKSILNLRLRKTHEMTVSASQGFDITNNIMYNDDKDKYETERLKLVYARLDEGVSILDDTILLHELF